jgi:glycosyltransferase involved in cell wall biosynthesis
MEKGRRMNPRISVVIPALNAECFIADAVRAIIAQPIARETFECIVAVDDGTRDRTAEAAQRAGAATVRRPDYCGRCTARNLGIECARGEWIAFTDADCVPSRRWLPAMLAAAQAADRSTLALAGQTIGLNSRTPAARFTDLIGALDAESYLSNAALPWAPSCNLACRREDLLAVGGFNPAFKSYEAADLSLRLRERFGGRFLYVRAAVVMHRHRSTWRELWEQQLSYGGGYAQFLLRYRDRWPWSARREAGAWMRLFPLAVRAAIARGEKGLVPRGLLLKQTAQRIGFATTFFSPRERQRVQGGEARA